MKQIKTILFAFGCSFLLSGTKAFAQVAVSYTHLTLPTNSLV